MSARLLLAALTIGLFVPTASAQRQGRFAGQLGRALTDAVRELDPGFWGAVYVGVQGREVLAMGYGLADRRRWPNTDKTLFDIGGVSMPFTASAIMRLEMKRKLSLDDSISKHLRGVPHDKRAITIRHLLQHTSGLSRKIVLPERLRTRDGMIAYVMKSELEHEPGSVHTRSDVNYMLLAAIIELASGKTFEHFLEQELFRPTTMNDTGFLGDRDLDRARATRRRFRRGEEVTDEVLFDTPWDWERKGAGGMITSTHDLFLWTRGLTGLRVLDEEAQAEQFTPGLGGYAIGWHVEELGGQRHIWHGGVTDGYHSMISFHPDDDIAVIVLSDERDLRTLEARLSELALAHVRGLDPEALPVLAGRYSIDGANRIMVEAVDGVLTLVPEGTQITTLLTYGVTTPPDTPRLFEELERTGREHLRVIARGDPAAAAKLFVSSEAAREGLDNWAVLRSELGRFSHASFIGSSTGRGMQTFLRGYFERGAAVIRISWGGKRKLRKIERWEEEAPFRLEMTPLTDLDYVARSFAGNAEIRLLFTEAPEEEVEEEEGLRGLSDARRGAPPVEEEEEPTDEEEILEPPVGFEIRGHLGDDQPPVILRAFRLPDDD